MANTTKKTILKPNKVPKTKLTRDQVFQEVRSLIYMLTVDERARMIRQIIDDNKEMQCVFIDPGSQCTVNFIGNSPGGIFGIIGMIEKAKQDAIGWTPQVQKGGQP